MNNNNKIVISGLIGSISGLIESTLLAIAVILAILGDEQSLAILIPGLVLNLLSVTVLEITEKSINIEIKKLSSTKDK